MLSFTSVCAIVSVEISLYSTHNFKKKEKRKTELIISFYIIVIH